MSGFIYQGEGKYEESIEEAKKALELDPDLNPAYVNLAYSYYFMDRFNDAQTAMRRATDRKVDFPEFAVLRYYISFMKGDAAGMQQVATSSRGISGAEGWVAQADTLTSAYSGHLRQAARSRNMRSMSRRTLVNMNRQLPLKHPPRCGRLSWGIQRLQSSLLRQRSVCQEAAM